VIKIVAVQFLLTRFCNVNLLNTVKIKHTRTTRFICCQSWNLWKNTIVIIDSHQYDSTISSLHDVHLFMKVLVGIMASRWVRWSLHQWALWRKVNTALLNQNAVTWEIEIAGKMRLKICYYFSSWKLKHSTVLWHN
jgi:archaellum biogenesis ATPase FlaH